MEVLETTAGFEFVGIGRQAAFGESFSAVTRSLPTGAPVSRRYLQSVPLQ